MGNGTTCQQPTIDIPGYSPRGCPAHSGVIQKLNNNDRRLQNIENKLDTVDTKVDEVLLIMADKGGQEKAETKQEEKQEKNRLSVRDILYICTGLVFAFILDFFKTLLF